jgi:Cytochrome c7 and related cytochrome c/Class III cytochrome C family
MHRYILPALVAIVVAIGWVFALPAAPLVQPIRFSHARHALAGCAVCHQGAATGVRAGIPQGDVCTRCHATAPGHNVADAVWSAVSSGKQIAWRRVNRLPDHVAFSHRRHTGPGQLACASCHGDMRQRTEPLTRAPVRLVMDTCLACHKREGASEDCAGCHR